MKRGMRIGAAAAVAACGLLLAPAQGQNTDNEFAKPVRELAGKVGKGQDVKKDAEGLAKKMDELHEVMHLYKLRSAKGMGVGDKPGGLDPDGIEKQIQKLAKDGISQPLLTKYAKELEQMGWDAAALAELTLPLPTKKGKAITAKD